MIVSVSLSKEIVDDIDEYVFVLQKERLRGEKLFTRSSVVEMLLRESLAREKNQISILDFLKKGRKTRV